jgi:dipeptidyl aminopeptidase/acylaminoacyl peptidase
VAPISGSRTISDENHGILKPNNSLLWYREVKRWLDEHGS